MKNIISERKCTLEGINSSLGGAEDWISNLEEKITENTRTQQHKEKLILKHLRDLGDKIKHSNICIIEVPEGGEREQGVENTAEEIVAENFPNLVKEKETQFKEV